MLAAWHAEQPWAERATIARGDVRDSGSMERALEEARVSHGRIHGCVVNAGIWPPDDVPLVDLDPERVDAVLGVNLAGAFWTARAIDEQGAASQFASVRFVQLRTEEPTPGDDDDSVGDDDDSQGDDDDSEGGGCSSSMARGAHVDLWWLLLALPLVRRRR